MATYRCPQCSRFRFDHLHLRGCLPRRMWAHELEQWPAPSQTPQEAAQDALTCECGYPAKSAAALRMHRLRAKVHQGAVA